MREPVEAIQRYVLHPDHNGLHLRQLAERMAQSEAPEGAGAAPQGKQSVERAAELLARFIYLVWGTSDPDEYAPWTYEMLIGLQRRMRGMEPHDAWDYALAAQSGDILLRLRKAQRITIDPEMETALFHSFFDSLAEHEYLHDVAQRIMDLHWQRRHGPGAITTEEIDRGTGSDKPRGDPEIEKHLERLAKEGLATYIEQANIGWGNIDNPTDPKVLLRDRIELQLTLGGKNAQTWEESAWRIADVIERRFGTRAARTKAREARAGWTAVS